MGTEVKLTVSHVSYKWPLTQKSSVLKEFRVKKEAFLQWKPGGSPIYLEVHLDKPGISRLESIIKSARILQE